MDDYIHDLLIRGIASIKGGEKESGRKALERLLDLDAAVEDRLDAWWYLSEISEDKKIIRGYLENILANEPSHARARRKLAILDGKLMEEEIVNPDQLRKESGKLVNGSAHRFTCPKCGGKMVYSPDGSEIICEFCENQDREKAQNGSSGEQDFFLAMATRKGHFRQMDTITFNCEGCGSEFILPPTHMTITCPYCGSAYVAKNSDPRSVLEPNSVFPFKISEEKVKEILRSWFMLHTPKEPFRVTSGLGIYLPVWSFCIEGPVPYHYQVEKEKNVITISAEDYLLESNILVSASGNPPAGWSSEIKNYDLDQVTAFNPAILSDWVAENYRVSVGEASLIGRQIALENKKMKLHLNLENGANNLQVFSSKMAVVSYELILLPIWLIHYKSDRNEYHALVNGGNGEVRDERYDQENLGQKLVDFLRRGKKMKFLT
jgi:DNA-directed RNA polymerase subunit RPC12/RpoP